MDVLEPGLMRSGRKNLRGFGASKFYPVRWKRGIANVSGETRF
jgi:hypothetical protein